MARAYNFSAGPATLPEPVLEQAREAMLEWRGTGASVMELSHRDKAFLDVAAEAEADLRRLLSVPDGYAVLFLTGGATTQQALLALNFAAPGQAVDHVVTGHWGRTAVRQAEATAAVHIAADAGPERYVDIPPVAQWRQTPGAAYLHYTDNETIHGVEFPGIPDAGDVPLVADFSSSIASRPLDFSRLGMVYAGAQKNLGPSGISVAVIRPDLLELAGQPRAPIFDYRQHARAGSMLNTPPTLNWYIAGRVFRWMLDEGGVEEFARRNARKAELLYSAIDGSGGFYRNDVAAPVRSRMNVPFFLHDAALEPRFLEQAGAAGLIGLKGHRALGGMRASIYNAMPLEGVQALVEFMDAFQRGHG